MTNYVFSTISTSVGFVQYSPPAPNRVPRVLRRVNIKGGANVAIGKPGMGLFTPRGVPTEVSDDELSFLLSDPKFVEMAKDGFLTVSNRKDDLDKAVRDMRAKDKSAPLTAADFNSVQTGKPADIAA